MIVAGNIRHRVTVQSASESQTDYGETSDTWAASATRWASIEPMSGTELLEAQQVHGMVTHRITVRETDLDKNDRILFGSRVFEVVAVLDKEERGRRIEVLCKERT